MRRKKSVFISCRTDIWNNIHLSIKRIVVAFFLRGICGSIGKVLVPAALAALVFSCAHPEKQKTVSLIFDSDIGPDYDDVGAIAILHNMEARGEVKILATVASNEYEGIAGVLDVFNTYFNRADIPIGVPKGPGVNLKGRQSWTDTLVARYPHAIDSNSQAPDAVEVYRKILSQQPDTSVTIVTVGFLTNLANLLHTTGDRFSPLNGAALVKKKVKLLVTMGGKYPAGKEFNLEKDAAASKEALENWPTPVILNGWEIGTRVKTGLPLVHNSKIQNSPVKDVFSMSIPKAPGDSAGRSSWDEITVLVAVRGYEPYFTLHPGRIEVADDGSNTWNDQGSGQFYLVEKEAPEKIETIINQLMMEQPKK